MSGARGCRSSIGERPTKSAATTSAACPVDGRSMVIDTSALLAILLNEPDASRFEAAIEEDPVRLMSAGSVLETASVVESWYGEPGGRELDRLVHRAGIEIVAVLPSP